MPNEYLTPVPEAVRILLCGALRTAVEDVLHLAASVAEGTAEAAPAEVWDNLRERGFDSPADGRQMMAQVQHLIQLLTTVGVHLAAIAIFDGSMDEETRVEFFDGEFLVGEDGEIVYALAG